MSNAQAVGSSSDSPTMDRLTETSVITTNLNEIHRALRDTTGGAPANYIPELANVDPDLFGIAVATTDGRIYWVGDADHRFTIQSISKPFVYGHVLDTHGLETVMSRVGVEPSGEAFNSITMDERNNRPLNPMVNTGAIACAAMLDGPDLSRRTERMLSMFATYAGRNLDVDEAVFESERSTGHRNRAIAHLELSSGMVDEPVADHLDLYFRQCSLLVSTVDLAMMAATLANGGEQPATGERAISRENVAKVLSVMSTCGMYDWSGEWMHRVGLPAKSGVGGGVIAVLPGQLGIAAFSPRLDEIGNSVRGIQACEELACRFGLHLFDVYSSASNVVRRHYDGAGVRSKRLRPAEHRARLATDGHRTVVIELQGDLYFSTAEQLVHYAQSLPTTVRTLIIDGHRLGSVDATALALLHQLCDVTNVGGARFVVAGAPDTLIAALRDGPDPWPEDQLAVDLDVALEHGEDELLHAAGLRVLPSTDMTDALEGSTVDILRDLDRDELEVVAAHLTAVDYEDSERIIVEGEESDRLYFLTAGRATARLALDGDARSWRLRSFEPGVAFGETALFPGGRRTAEVVAEGPVRCLELNAEGIAKIADERPDLHAKMLMAVGRSLSDLLAQAMVEIRALS